MDILLIWSSKKKIYPFCPSSNDLKKLSDKIYYSIVVHLTLQMRKIYFPVWTSISFETACFGLWQIYHRGAALSWWVQSACSKILYKLKTRFLECFVVFFSSYETSLVYKDVLIFWWIPALHSSLWRKRINRYYITLIRHYIVEY